ncbi:hypothetical protein BB560_003546 [Smittium megazygosporum]|uniref:VanZ-like domain-containing protein n=1 Tax=Smittium megazygosporum TaxID=133381 RepID=A0A2T9ZBQ1_9FUNG|nr:hypothetical protein BB560_003546 [Smittium megazygosporum]
MYFSSSSRSHFFLIVILIIISCASLFAEVFQLLFTSTRTFDYNDIMFNLLGSYLFLIISLAIDNFILKPRSNRQIDLMLVTNSWDSAFEAVPASSAPSSPTLLPTIHHRISFDDSPPSSPFFTKP